MASPLQEPPAAAPRSDNIMRTESSPAEINIADVLRLALPINTTLIGGGVEARRFVNWVVVLSSWEDIESQIEPHDLVIVPPHLFAPLDSGHREKALEALADLPVAGLVCIGKLAEELTQKAETLNLTVLIIPETSSVRDVHQNVSLLLLDRQTATSERAIQLYRQLSDMSREGQGLAAMTEVMSKLTGNIVAVQDKRLEIQAISWPSNSTVNRDALIEALQQRDALPPVLRNRKAAAKSKQSIWQQLLPLDDSSIRLARLVSPIISGDRARGYLSVIGPVAELDMFDSLTVEHGAAACALEMAKTKAVNEAKKSLRGDFLEGLLAGSLPRKEIERLEGRLDHNTAEPHAVMVAGWMGTDKPSMRRLETSVHWVLSNHPRPALVHIYGNQYLVIFQALKNAEDMESAHQLGRRIREQIELEFPDATLMGGISGPANTLSEWPSSYNQALQAMQLGERLKLTNQFVEFGSLGIYRLLYDLEELPGVRKFTDEIMQPLIEYDSQNRGSLVKTVEAYFDHHGNISQTAESLFVHRNTLLYRMERIEELTGLNLDQSNMRLALHLSLKLWQLRPETEPPPT